MRISDWSSDVCSSDLPSMIASAWSIVGSVPGGRVNWSNRPAPMPTITASTSTFTPDDITLPSTFSARNAVLFQNANGTSTNPASAVSLNSIRVTNSCTASTKKLSTHTTQARNSTVRSEEPTSELQSL